MTVELEILQDNFTSITVRDEFSRAVKIHGALHFLQHAKSPLPRPTVRDLNMVGRSSVIGTLLAASPGYRGLP